MYPPATVKQNFMLKNLDPVAANVMKSGQIPAGEQHAHSGARVRTRSHLAPVSGALIPPHPTRPARGCWPDPEPVPGAAAAPIGAARPENSVRKCKGLDFLTIFAVSTTNESIHRKSLHRYDNAALYPRRVGQCRPAVSLAVDNGKGGAVFHSRPKHKYNGKF